MEETINICEECRFHVSVSIQKQKKSSIEHVLSSMDLLTIWEGIQARVNDMVEFSSSSGELLIFPYFLLVLIESSRMIIQQHIGIVLQLNNEVLMEERDETWSYSTEEILEKCGKLILNLVHRPTIRFLKKIKKSNQFLNKVKAKVERAVAKARTKLAKIFVKKRKLESPLVVQEN